MKFLIGIVVGIVISTAGFSGVARMLDRGIEAVKIQTEELTK